MKRKIFGILFAVVLMVSLSLVTAAPAAAATWYLTPGDDIQAAVNGASQGDKIILDGTFNDYPTVTVGTSGITIKSLSPGSGILDGGVGPAFRLVDGLSNVTFEGLVIQNRTGSRGGGIEAWDMSTSNIQVSDNQFLNNEYNGILVGSEGGYVHSNWMVKGNTANGNGFAGIELTNCENSKIMKNNVADSGFAGIVVQARNTVADSGSVTINAVEVLHNTVDDSGSSGIYVFSFTGHPTAFTPISGASSLLTNTTVNNNTIVDSGSVGVIFWAYNAAAMADNASINHNSITGASGEAPSGYGVRVLQAGSGPGTVKNVKVINNSYVNCAEDVQDTGTGTKIKP